MDAFPHASAEHARQVAPQRLGDERREGGDQLRGGRQAFVQGPVGVELFLRLAIGGPETVPAAAHIPVAQRVHELRQRRASRVVVVSVHPLGRGGDRPLQFAEDPAVELAAFGRWPIATSARELFRRQLIHRAHDPLARIEAVDVRVDDEKAVAVPEPQEELGDAVLDRLLAVADRRPGRLVGEEIPAQRVGAVAVEDLLRLAVVPLALRHLLAVLAQHQPQDDAIAERVRVRRGPASGRRFIVLAEEHRADRELAVEPAASLIDRLADEIGRELGRELLGVPPGIAPLRERHRPRVVPAVNNVRHPPHPRTGGEGRIVRDGVDVRLMNPQIVGQFGTTTFRFLPGFGARSARLGEQFVVTGDRLHAARRLADPDRQRRSPETLAGQRPVDVRFQEIAEPAVANVIRQPIDPLVVGEHPVAVTRGADEPTAAWILNQRIVVGAPAERIRMQVLFLMEQQTAGLELAADIFIRLLDPSSHILGRRLGGEFAVRAHRANEVGPFTRFESRLLRQQHFEVHLAERRRLVDDPRTAVERDEIGGHNAPSKMLRPARPQPTLDIAQARVVVGKRRQVAFAEQLRPALGREHFEFAFELAGERFDERRREDQPLARLRVLHGRVLEIGMDRRELIAGKRPWRGRPNQQRRVRIVDERKAHVNARIGHFAIA